MKMKTITLSGGFHGAADIDLRVKNGVLSAGQYKRLNNHMCGIKDCVCGWRGFDLTGIDRAAFRAMLDDVNYKSWATK